MGEGASLIRTQSHSVALTQHCLKLRTQGSPPGRRGEQFSAWPKPARERERQLGVPLAKFQHHRAIRIGLVPRETVIPVLPQAPRLVLP